jgi:hypothetical protein
LSEKARLDSRTREADLAKANTVNNDMKRNTSTLIEEMQRKTGESK